MKTLFERAKGSTLDTLTERRNDSAGATVTGLGKARRHSECQDGNVWTVLVNIAQEPEIGQTYQNLSTAGMIVEGGDVLERLYPIIEDRPLKQTVHVMAPTTPRDWLDW